jgi:hypothetical protein
MKVFISYSTAADQIVALRLQTLAVVSMDDVTVYVPPAFTRQSFNDALNFVVAQELEDSDVVLAVMIHNPVQSAVHEMNLALSRHKPLIPLVTASVSPDYYASFPHFLLDPNDPSKAEADIVRHLASLPRSYNGWNKPLLALCTLALGMILVSAGPDSR